MTAKRRRRPHAALPDSKPGPYLGHLVDVKTGAFYRPATNGEWRAYKNAVAEMQRHGADGHEWAVIIVDKTAVTIKHKPGYRG